MKERETQAAASWRFVETRTNQNAEVMRLNEAKLRRIVEIRLALVNAHRPSGGNTGGAQFFKLESLILAQNERWRQA
jgi:hypothetical protein